MMCLIAVYGGIIDSPSPVVTLNMNVFNITSATPQDGVIAIGNSSATPKIIMVTPAFSANNQLTITVPAKKEVLWNINMLSDF